MSHFINDNLEERAKEVCSYFESTDLETAILNNLERGDLEMVAHLVMEGEAEISRQEFHNYDMLPEREITDAY